MTTTGKLKPSSRDSLSKTLLVKSDREPQGPGKLPHKNNFTLEQTYPPITVTLFIATVQAMVQFSHQLYMQESLPQWRNYHLSILLTILDTKILHAHVMISQVHLTRTSPAPAQMPN